MMRDFHNTSNHVKAIRIPHHVEAIQICFLYLRFAKMRLAIETACK